MSTKISLKKYLKFEQIIVFLTLFASLIFATKTLPQSINLENVILNTSNKNVSIQIFLDIIDPKKLHKIIKHNKFQIVFSYHVEIQKKVRFFFDKTVFSRDREWSICFNPINNKFSLRRKNKQIYSTDSLDKLLEKIRIITLKLPIWTTPTGKEKYDLILKFGLKKKVPYWIEKTLFFWNFNITPPSEYHIDFKF
ncbi:hypothetical protein JCM12298_23800 [Desulfothermus naphthae]